MNEISLLVRNTSFFSRGLMFAGAVFAAATLQILPESSSLFLFSILILLIGVYVYFNTPKSKIILLGLDENKLNYTSSANPFFAVGDLYDETNSVKLADIVYIGMEKQYVHDVGHYLHIKLYLKDTGVTSIWIAAEHTEKTWSLIRKVMASDDNIKILISNYKEVKYIFSEYSDRIVEALPDGASFEPWKINTSKRELFSDDEWLQLLMAPICIFNMVAKADGKIQAQEISVFVNKLKESEQYNSFFVHECFSKTLHDFDKLFDQYDEQALVDHTMLKSTFDMLAIKADESELLSFAQALIDLAEKIAQAAGEKYKWVSDEEERLLAKIRSILPVINNYRN